MSWLHGYIFILFLIKQIWYNNRKWCCTNLIASQLLCCDFRPESSFKEEKIIVSVTALQRLFHCHTCALPCSFTMVREGGWVEFKVTCASCHRSYTWETTARVNRAHVINPLLAAASLFSGGCLTQNLRFLSLLNIAIPSHSVCLYQQREYLHGVSVNIYS